MNDRQNDNALVSQKIILMALGFGSAALLVKTIGLSIPVFGTVGLDPRELFVTLGAALTGPVGGILIGFMARDWSTPILHIDSLISQAIHMAGGLWIGYTYKKLAYRRTKFAQLLLRWSILVAIYYYLILVLGYVLIAYALARAYFEATFGGLSFGQAYVALAQAATAEFIITLVITAIILAILPPKSRRPLW
jgi:hypothetical protein